MSATERSRTIRGFALTGHGAAGKTSLTDALLFHAKAVDRKGSVDDGTSLSDCDEEEHKRRFSIDASILHADWNDNHLLLLDAPGYPDFVGAALGTLNAVENAVIVVSAAAGVQVNTRRMANEACHRGLARFFVVNKIDADNLDLPALLASMRATFGTGCVPVNAPLGVGSACHGVVRVAEAGPQPADCPFRLAELRGQLIDAVADSDEALMERYLNDGDLSADAIEAAIPRAVRAGTLMPVFFVRRQKDIGVPELLAGLSHYGLSPLEGKPRPVAEGEPLAPAADGSFVGLVFKTLTDKFVGHLAYLKVVRGRLTADHALVNLRTGKNIRINGLLRVQGKQSSPVAEAWVGDIVALAKVDGLHIGDTVAVDANAPRLLIPAYPMPMFGLAVEPSKRGDEQKISDGLHKMADEDPTFRVAHDVQTHELVIQGVSQLHLDVVQARLKRRFNLEVLTHEPKIPYRETIGTEGAADHRHKKQSGGRGQFAEVHLRVYPLSRDITSEQQLIEVFANKERFEKMRAVHYDPKHNFAFIDHIVGGSIPNQFIPAVEKGCKELIERGALAGYTIQDVAVEVHFGKDHPVDSSEAAFKTAGRIAFKKAVLAARPMLLEPIVHLEVTVPSKYTGSVLGDLNTKRGRVEKQDSLPGDLAVIVARVPLAEVTRYTAQLGSMTQGQGSYTMEFSHYEQVPPNVQQQIVAKAKLAADEDE